MGACSTSIFEMRRREQPHTMIVSGPSKAFALTWYRALTWYSLRLSPPRTHFEPWKAVSTWGRGSLAAR